jgi:hypothetical protein
MSRDEVKSLNDLAMAHGGQLTINPHTGLPEAGFLSNLLPTIAGFALSAAVPELGAMTGLGSFAAPAIVGGASMLMGGGLKSGLMAGLGAYGGSQLAGSLATSGLATNAADISAQNTAQAEAQAELARKQAIEDAARNSMDIRPPVAVSPDAAAQSAREYYSNLGSPSAVADTSRMSNIQTGLSSAANDPMAFLKANKYALAAAAAPGIMGALPSGQSRAGADKVAEMNTPVPQRYRYDPGAQIQSPNVPSVNQLNKNFGTEAMNFQAPNRYVPIGADEAKSIYGFASGGMAAGKNPIEQMSNQNSIGANTGFPQAYLHNNAYATPYQTPVSQNVLTGPGDVGVDPYTGEQQMASGGMASGGIYDGGPGSTTSSSEGPAVGTGGYGGYASPVDAATAQQGIDSLVSLAMPLGIATAIMDAITGPTTSPVSQGSVTGTSLGSLGPASEGPAPSSVSDSDSAPSAPSDGGAPGMGGGARGGYLSHGRFDQRPRMATGGISDAHYNLGGYSDGGRLLRGPGDGVSDSIPATIGHKQPARLADGEFVVPARIVSELGNGSTEAGARKLYAMMDRVQAARKKTVGKDRVAHNSRADRYLPA